MPLVPSTLRSRLAGGLASTALRLTAACGGATVNSGGAPAGGRHPSVYGLG